MNKLIKYLIHSLIHFITFGVVLVGPAYLLSHYVTEVYRINSILSFAYLIFASFVMIKFNFFKKQKELKKTLSKNELNFLKICDVLIFISIFVYSIYTKEYIVTVAVLLVGVILLIDKKR